MLVAGELQEKREKRRWIQREFGKLNKQNVSNCIRLESKPVSHTNFHSLCTSCLAQKEEREQSVWNPLFELLIMGKTINPAVHRQQNEWSLISWLCAPQMWSLVSTTTWNPIDASKCKSFWRVEEMENMGKWILSPLKTRVKYEKGKLLQGLVCDKTKTNIIKYSLMTYTVHVCEG